MSYHDILNYYKCKKDYENLKFIESSYIANKTLFEQYIYLSFIIKNSEINDWICITNGCLKPTTLTIDVNNEKYFDIFYNYYKNYSYKELKMIHLIIQAADLITIEKKYSMNNNFFKFIFYNKSYTEIFCTKDLEKITEINDSMIKRPSFLNIFSKNLLRKTLSSNKIFIDT